VVPGGTPHLAARPAKQGVVDHQVKRGLPVQQPGGDQVHQQQAERIRRPAGCREEPVRAGVVPAPGQARADQHPGDGALAGLGEEPRDQPTEGPKRRRGEAGTEHDEQVGKQAR